MSSHLNKTNNKFYKYPGDEIWVLLTLISKHISRLTKNDIRRHRCNKIKIRLLLGDARSKVVDGEVG